MYMKNEYSTQSGFKRITYCNFFPELLLRKSVKSERMLCDAVRSKQQCYLVSWLEHVLWVRGKICKFFRPLSVITQVLNLLNGIWRHHLLSNKVGQKSCSLILENNHCKFSVICVRFMCKYLAMCFSLFLTILCRLSFLKTFLDSGRFYTTNRLNLLNVR